MTVRQLIEDVLLGVGVSLELLCCLGFFVVRNVFDRLHYAMAATTLGPILIAAAIVVRESLTQPGINAILVAVLLFVLGPVVATATARAARIRRLGQVEPTAEEVERS